MIKKDWADYQAEELFERLEEETGLASDDVNKALNLIAAQLREVWSKAQPRDAVDM